jgi:hypothetical protein
VRAVRNHFDPLRVRPKRCLPADSLFPGHIPAQLDQEPARAAALHPNLGELAEDSRDLLWDHHPAGIRRGTFRSVRDLKEAIRVFIDGWNDRCQPVVWTKDVDTILAKAQEETYFATGTLEDAG